MNNNKAIHETMLKDIVDLAIEAKNSNILKNISSFKRGTDYQRSINSRADGMIMVFPVLASKNLDISHAAMVSKAMERHASTILNIAFSTIQIENSKDALDYVSNFHTNLRFSETPTVDEMMYIMDKVGEVAGMNESTATIQPGDPIIEAHIKKDMKNLNFYLEDGISESAISKYRYMNSGIYGDSVMVVKEDLEDYRYELEREKLALAREKENREANSAQLKDNEYIGNQFRAGQKHFRDGAKRREDAERHGWDKEDRSHVKKKQGWEADEQLRRDAEHNMKINDEDRKGQKHAVDMAKSTSDILRSRKDIITNNLQDNDVRKANELMPTTMVVNYFIQHGDSNGPITPVSILMGVKAKIYPIEGMDIVDRLTAKNKNNNSFQKFIKATTREISFLKDFLFAIEQAKLDALSRSRRGSSSKLWKVLERRATRSSLKRALGSKNDATAISTLCISQEEVEYMKKEYDIDIENPGTIRPIMESYNLMCFCIVDEVNEVCKFLFDTGNDLYESYSFNSLERESSDSSYKKVVNLMSKISK